MTSKPKRHWRIVGYDSQDVIIESSAPGNLTEGEVERMLQRLVCRHLSDREVVAASLTRNHRGQAKVLLCVNHDRRAKHYTISAGNNPHYVAALIPTDGV